MFVWPSYSLLCYQNNVFACEFKENSKAYCAVKYGMWCKQFINVLEVLKSFDELKQKKRWNLLKPFECKNYYYTWKDNGLSTSFVSQVNVYDYIIKKNNNDYKVNFRVILHILFYRIEGRCVQILWCIWQNKTYLFSHSISNLSLGFVFLARPLNHPHQKRMIVLLNDAKTKETAFGERQCIFKVGRYHKDR